MPTYANAYRLLEEVRYGIGEYSDALVSGMLPGTHRNEYLMNEINRAQMLIYALALDRIPGEFLKKADLTGVDSVFTLPADFAQVIIFKNERKLKVERINVDRLSRSGGSDRLYYRMGNTLILEKSGVTDTYELWYRSRPRQIHTSRFLADNAVNDLALDTAKIARIDDYYNGMKIENINLNKVDTISDFVAATGLATVVTGGTHNKGDFYGLVPELPEPLHILISAKAILNIRSTSPVIKSKPTKADFELYNDLLVTAFEAYSDYEEDVDFEEIFTDNMPPARQWGIVAE